MLVSYLVAKNKSEYYRYASHHHEWWRTALKYFITVIVTLLGLALKVFLNKTIHYPEGGFLISLGTVMISAWYGGIWPGITAVFLNYFISDWFFISPQKLFFEDRFVDQVRFIFFLVEGIMISWFFELLHRSHEKTRESLFIISQNERLVRSLIENISNHAIFMVDAQGTIQTWSEGATKMTGYQANEILNRPFSILLPTRKTKENATKTIFRTTANLGQHKRERWCRRKDASVFWAEITVTALPTFSPDEQKFSVIIHDITARKRTDELKNELLSIITHELRTPVAIMKVIVEKALLTHTNEQVIGNIEDFTDLQGEVDRLSLLVENILDISKLRLRKFSLHRQDIELTSLVEQLVTRMRLVAGTRVNIRMRSSKPVHIYADRERIGQVLMNLLDNAIKFTPESGVIEVSLAVENNMAIVSVFNETDREIPKKEALRIFDKFYQLTKRPVNGLGLGLYIAKELITLHQGRMWVNSEPHRGNIFSFSLPIK